MPELEVVGGEQLRRHMTDPRLVTLPVTEMLHTAAKEGEKVAISRVQGMSSVVRSIHSDSRALNARVYSTHRAAQHIEVGRKPGSRLPPVAVMARWAAERGFVADPFLLARAVARRGIKGRYFMRGARSRMKLRWRQYLKGAAADIQRRWRI
jgi:hypothetical protein